MTPSTMGSGNRPYNLIHLLLPPAFWLGAWQLGAWLVEFRVQGRGNELLLPYPATVLAALLRLASASLFWKTVLASLLRILVGMGVGTLLGAVLAVLTCLSPWCNRLLSGPIRVIRATPVASFILLVLLWTDRSFVASVISALMVLPVVWANLSRGIGETDPQLLELARAYRYSVPKTVTLIYFPSLRPYFLSAITTAMGLAWKSGVAAEVLCTPRNAIGTQIYNTKLYLEVPDLFAWTAVVVMLSLLLEGLLRLVLNRWSRGWTP
ncbi:MAG: ABC transporter permease subunit [Lawsonibacter sp.]|nr:ABC transporter permease subunit [Lawsonibacter sp.]